MFKGAKWIKHPTVENKDGSFLFRKSFNADEGIEKATLMVCSLGYGEYTINGHTVSDEVLCTPLTKFDTRVLYNQYDVTKLIVTGENVCTAFVGNGWYNDTASTWDYHTASWRDTPKFIAMLKLNYTDGKTKNIISDTSWKTAEGPSIYNHVRQGEIYDARLEIGGWQSFDFDDSLWKNTENAASPGGMLEPMAMPPVRVIRSLEGTHIGNGIYDFGENISGRVSVKMQGNSGDIVKIYYSENLDDNRNSLSQANNVFTKRENAPLSHECHYIMKGGDIEEYAPKFGYFGFRYVMLENTPKVFEMKAEVMHTDLSAHGSFECSDEMLNKIHEASVRATLMNYVSVPTDCPHREQNGWTGDASLSAQQALLNFDMRDSYLKWMKDFTDVQRPSGQLPGIIPTSSWGYNWGSGPAWDSALILIPWYVYQNSGDISLISFAWDAMVRYMSYFAERAENGIADFGLGDWCAPKTAVLCPTSVTDTAYYYVDLMTMGRCAKLLGFPNEDWFDLAASVKRAWRNKFLQDNSLSEIQTFHACAIYQGLLEDDEIPKHAEILADLVKKNGYHIDCGILGTKYIFSALSDNGYTDTLIKMVKNPEMPSYAYWINQGATTLCEMWEMTESLNHHMYSEVDHWFYRNLAGIRLDEKGLVIAPCFTDELTWVKASHKDISVKWDEKQLEIFVPCSAKIILGDKEHTVNPGHHVFLR
jgi:Alpha-L-rhamnosidase N-terminal domain./Bacterial alpha-L-rhamnosidase.